MSTNRHSREDALDKYYLLDLYRGALKIDDAATRFLACYLILICGRLGARIGEALHVHAGWIDWQRGFIRIPRYQPCGCRYCWERAESKATTALQKRNTDEEANDQPTLDDLTDLPVEDVHEQLPESERGLSLVEHCLYKRQWEPKTKMSSRVLPFNWSTRIGACLAKLCKDGGSIDADYKTAYRALKRAARNSEHLTEDDVSPHALRATAETWWADIGLPKKARRDLGGWEQDRMAWKYTANSPEVLSDKIRVALGMNKLTVGAVDFLTQQERPLPGEPFDVYRLKEDREDLVNPMDPGPVIHPRPGVDYKGHEYDRSRHESQELKNGQFSEAERRHMIEQHFEVDVGIRDPVDDPWPTIGDDSNRQSRFDEWLGAATPSAIAVLLTASACDRMRRFLDTQIRAWTPPYLNEFREPVSRNPSRRNRIALLCSYLGVVGLYVLLLGSIGLRTAISTGFTGSLGYELLVASVVHVVLFVYVHWVDDWDLRPTRIDPLPRNPFQ